jgi:hypothetical protein
LSLSAPGNCRPKRTFGRNCLVNTVRPRNPWNGCRGTDGGSARNSRPPSPSDTLSHQVAGSFAIGVFVTPAFAVGFGVAAGYAVVYILVIQYRRRDIELVEAVVDDEFLGE